MKAIRFILSGIVLLCGHYATAAGEPAATMPVADIKPATLETFMDGVWEAQSESHRAVGGVVTVVSADRVLLNKGYGYADLENLRPVDPDTTLFRIASVSKTFTWIAVMQLVAEGKLDLHTDINQYLKSFQIPETYPEPITMAHLMSHSAGFEDVVLDLGRRDAADLLPLAEYLKDNLPERVRPVGQHASYSNHSTAIAAHVVEQISGQDWFTYIEQNITGPLAMTHTSARHPMSEQHRLQLAKSYTWSSGSWQEETFLHWLIYPAAMISTSGGDMAKYMQAHLAQGAGVLAKETFQQMLEPLWQPVPNGSAWLHGYVQRQRNGVTIYGHGGDLNGFHSTMIILPEQNLAVFASFNTDPASAIRTSLANAFVDHFFKASPPQRPKPKPDAAAQQAEYHGSYASLRRNFSDFSKLALLPGATTVATNAKGYLTISGQNGTRQFVHVSGDEFVARYGAERMLFIRNENGAVTHLESSSYPAAAMDKLAMLDNPRLHQILFALVAIVMLVCLIYWPIRLWRYQREGADGVGFFSPGHYGFAWLLAAATLYTVAGLFQGLGDTAQFYFEVPGHIETLLLVLLITCVLLLVNTAWIFVGVLKGAGNRWEKLVFLCFAGASLIYVWLGYYWNTLRYYV
jgi:CubicO group peptidase (beta-lactamase class C family)